MLDLTKGMVLDLNKTNESIKNIAVGVNWGKIQKTRTITETIGGFLGFGGKKEQKEIIDEQIDVDLDLSALLYDKNGNLVDKIYYGNLSCSGIKHSGDDLVGDSEQDDDDNEVIDIELSKLDSSVSKIVFVLVSFRGQDFAEIPYAQINLYDTTSEKSKVANTVEDISKSTEFSGKTSMIFASLEKNSAGWSYKIINEPTNKRNLGDLVSICSNK